MPVGTHRFAVFPDVQRTFSRGVNRTFHLSMLCTHSHRAVIISASAYSSVAFLSFVFFVLFSIWRQSTCLFTRPDIARLSHPRVTRFICYRRLTVDLRIDRLCPVVSGRAASNSLYAAWHSRHTMTNSRHHLLCSSPFNKHLHCQFIQVWSSSNKRRVSSLGQTVREWLSHSLVTRVICNSNLPVYLRTDCCWLYVSGAAAPRRS